MVSFILSGLSAAVLLLGLAQATPVKRQGVSTLDQCQFTSYKPFGYYAAAAYCPYAEIQSHAGYGGIDIAPLYVNTCTFFHRMFPSLCCGDE